MGGSLDPRTQGGGVGEYQGSSRRGATGVRRIPVCFYFWAAPFFVGEGREVASRGGIVPDRSNIA